MAARRRPSDAEVARRTLAWADEWRAAAMSTERADRPHAEAAIRRLYQGSGRPAPDIRWVPSPRAGLLAYGFASLSSRRIVNPLAKGDIGNGLNRRFNGLADPFGLERAWEVRLERRSPTRGHAGAMWTQAAVRSAIAQAALPLRVAGDPDPGVLQTAARILGEAWSVLVGSFGEELAGRLFAAALADLVRQVLAAPGRRRNAVQAMQPGQWDPSTPIFAASRDVLGTPLWHRRAGRAAREAAINDRLDIARSAGPWWALEGLAIVSERPLLHRADDRGRPHSADGPAMAWSDGFEIYAWHGVVVDRSLVIEPERITIAAIDGERNVERRRVMIERFGVERLIREGGAKLVDEDETGRLWRRDLPLVNWTRDEPVVMVEVVNATPEPDGSRKTYFLRVPPNTFWARSAVAWTFGLGSIDYHPTIES